ncbi:hypothetical protein P389DRAFT_799 [Cystobasidium minutum MCA 4210]|uniref:uncharacterized protein n=1 Tax=Cystobasidium minutum MCA 4210 TaxID=1397322 RepID=UPI0034CFAD59|eukprot:jgi/Rhomi1/799/CE798_487
MTAGAHPQFANLPSSVTTILLSSLAAKIGALLLGTIGCLRTNRIPIARWTCGWRLTARARLPNPALASV